MLSKADGPEDRLLFLCDTELTKYDTRCILMVTFVSEVFFMEISIIAPIGAVLALIVTILLSILVIPEKRRAKLGKFGKFLHDLCNFKFLIVEKIFQFFYTLATAFSVIGGFLMLFMVEEQYHYSYSYRYGYETYTTTEWVGYYGLLVMILGPIAIRIVYELLMLGLIAIKNIIQINSKLKDQNANDTATPTFAQPVAAPAPQNVAPATPVPTPVAFNEAEMCTCPYCGSAKKVNEFCTTCGQK